MGISRCMHIERTYLSNLNFQQDTNLSSAKGLRKSLVQYIENTPDSKVHGANMGVTRVLSGQDGSHVGLMNLAIWDGRCPISQDNHYDLFNNRMRECNLRVPDLQTTCRDVTKCQATRIVAPVTWVTQHIIIINHDAICWWIGIR